MNKFILCMAMLVVSSCYEYTYAQETRYYTLTVEGMFELAEQNSKRLQAEKTFLAQAAAAVKEAQSDRLPDIEASISAAYIGDGWISDRDFTNGTSAPMPHFGNNFAFQVSQIVYAGGSVSQKIELARLEHRNSSLSLEQNRQQIRFLLVGDYLDLYKQCNMLEVYDNNIRLTEQVLNCLRLREQQGIVLKNDLTRYELLLENLRFERLRIENTVSILNRSLAVTLGLPDGTVIRPDSTLPSTVPYSETRDFWHEAALENSTALRRLDLAKQIDRRQDKLIRAQRLPSISLFASDCFNSPILIEVPPINKNFNYWQVGIGISYNFSSLYKTGKSLRRQRLAARRTEELYEAQLQRTGLDIDSDFIRFTEACTQMVSQRKNVQLAKENYRIVSHRYENDMALLTDMLDASNALLKAEIELTNTRINIIFNYYKLHYTAGTL